MDLDRVTGPQPSCEEGWTEHLDFSFHSRRYRLSLQKTTNKTCPDIYLLTGQSEAISWKRPQTTSELLMQVGSSLNFLQQFLLPDIRLCREVSTNCLWSTQKYPGGKIHDCHSASELQWHWPCWSQRINSPPFLWIHQGKTMYENHKGQNSCGTALKRVLECTILSFP